MSDVLRDRLLLRRQRAVLNNTTEDGNGENAFTSYSTTVIRHLRDVLSPGISSEDAKEGDSSVRNDISPTAQRRIRMDLLPERRQTAKFLDLHKSFPGGPVVVEEEGPVEEAPAPEAPPAAETVAQVPSAPPPPPPPGDIAIDLRSRRYRWQRYRRG